MGYIYITRVGSFTSPGIDTGWSLDQMLLVSYPIRYGQSVVVFCPGTQAHVTDRPGLERTTLGSSVRLANHPATAPQVYDCSSYFLVES